MRAYILPAAPGQNSGARSPAQAGPSLPKYYDESSILWKSKLNVLLLSNVALGSPARSAAIARRDRAFSGARRPDRRQCGCCREPTHNAEPLPSPRSWAGWRTQAGLVAAQFLGWGGRRPEHAQGSPCSARNPGTLQVGNGTPSIRLQSRSRCLLPSRPPISEVEVRPALPSQVRFLFGILTLRSTSRSARVLEPDSAEGTLMSSGCWEPAQR
ncbi:unnamed protein product [Rangifer tarandus platyrhynchus]|uniref:Uncharacterized protein n=3 Tax=Rangifer tarandus platyrhynchus TaxID=3082113 RepID=A0AC59YLN2_RANTA|nr:unnamed protein product [Rangifer tarandus platyrhynchus]CAI9698488.1 unnamed protein product [Rangifer tarandus platyrhynchus]